MAHELKTLAGEILEARGGARGRCRVPDALRRKVIDALAVHQAAGGGVMDGIEELGLQSASFYRWLRQLGMFEAWRRKQVHPLNDATGVGRATTHRKTVAITKATTSISPLTFVEMTPVSVNALEVVLPTELRIRVRPGFDDATLKRLLDVLERR